MSFILKMAWRDSRRARARLALYSFSVAVGIAALVAIGSFTENLRAAIDAQAKTLLGADLAVTSREPFTPELQQRLDQLGGEQSKEVALASMALFPSSVKEVDRMYDKIEREIAARYSLGYVSSDTRTDGAWRNVDIRLTRTDLKGARLRTRQGYFAPLLERDGK